jgi:25S rRNA (adenine2142-N1)-methyltransferase
VRDAGRQTAERKKIIIGTDAGRSVHQQSILTGLRSTFNVRLELGSIGNQKFSLRLLVANKTYKINKYRAPVLVLPYGLRNSDSSRRSEAVAIILSTMTSNGAVPPLTANATPVLAKTKTQTKPSLNHNRLAPLPITKSRKRARKITTLYHRYTQLKEKALTIDEKRNIDILIHGMGGQTAYQRASQVSTSYHSTSKWVLGCLAQNGLLYGIDDAAIKVSGSIAGDAIFATSKKNEEGYIRRRPKRRDTRLLEIGAINTELLDAAEATIARARHGINETDNEKQNYSVQKKYRLHVRAIDLHSMHDRIEEADFLSLPLVKTDCISQKYDVIVCSMVLNCVPTALKRGAMLLRIVHFLRPGGLVYITVPKTCLNLSPYLDANQFTKLLQHVGLTVLEHKKETPKIAFFIGQKTSESMDGRSKEWQTTTIIRHGRKYRSNFAIALPDDTI